MRISRTPVALGVTLSAVCLWIAFRQVPLVDLAARLRLGDYRWLLVYPVLATALNLLRSEIWRLLLGRRVTRANAFWAYGTGFLVNNVLPFRMGEAARIGLLAAREQLPVVEVAAAAGLERVLDLVWVIAIVAISLPVNGVGPDVRRALLGVQITAVVAIGAIGIVIVAGHRFTGVLSALSARLMPQASPPIVARWRELTTGLSAMRRPGVALRTIVGSAVVWMITIVLQWTVLKAFQPNAGLQDAALLVGLVSIAAAVPAAPGAIGTYQWVAQQALALPFPALYTPSRALAAALVSHAASYVFSSMLGAIGLWYFGVSLSRLRRIDDRVLEPVRAR